MISKNWLTRSVVACGISALFCGAASAGAAEGAPAIALIDAADAPHWQAPAAARGWRVIAGAAAQGGGPATSIDARVQALAAAVRTAIEKGEADPARIYLAGRGDASAGVFYTVSRVPDLWAAAVAIGGSPAPAIDTGRLFTANLSRVPLLWAGAGAGGEALAAKLKTAGLDLEWRPAAGLTDTAVFDWLATHQREAFPATIDCETNSPTFPRCYWIEMTRFDAQERNDVLPSTELRGGSGASLDLGAFSYKTDDPGPGILVSALPPKYNGPLKVGDRIVELDGGPIADAQAYTAMMAKVTEEKQAVVMVQRGRERKRVETRIVLSRRDAFVTARVQGQYLPAEKQIQIMSRTVTEMRLTVPPQWAGSKLFWNGLVLEKIDAPGCYRLTIDKELLHAAPCR